MKLRKRIVYVVDDEYVIAETLAMILNQAGFIALSFQDPKMALAAAGFGAPPDLLISDIVMPQMSGIDLAIRFCRSCPACRVLLFSGQAATSNLLEAARRQGYEFDVLSKPVHPSDLLARVREFSQDDESACAENSVSSNEHATR
jgi:DNA-binding NtrC family response regulator